MKAFQAETDRAERLLEAALWLQRAGDLRGGQTLINQALVLQPTSPRAQLLLRMLQSQPGPITDTALPDTLEAGEPVTAPYPVPAPLLEDYVMAVSQPLLLETVRSLDADNEVAEDTAVDVPLMDDEEPLSWEDALSAELRGTPVIASKSSVVELLVPSAHLFWEGAEQAPATYALRFVAGPLTGDIVPLSEDTLHLGQPKTNATLRQIAGSLVLRDNGLRGGTYVSLQSEEQILSGTCIRAGDTEYRYERVRDDTTAECFHFLHELGVSGETLRTIAICDGLCSVGQDVCNQDRPQDSQVAPIHFELTCGPWATYLVDRSGPHRGTFIRLTVGEPWPLESGQVVRAGEHVFRVQRVNAD